MSAVIVLFSSPAACHAFRIFRTSSDTAGEDALVGAPAEALAGALAATAGTEVGIETGAEVCAETQELNIVINARQSHFGMRISDFGLDDEDSASSSHFSIIYFVP